MAAGQMLEPKQLTLRCNPDQFTFQTTAELDEVTQVVGQARAFDALCFGVGMRREGYNLYVLGPSGSGKHTMVRQHLEQIAHNEPVPSDWCYVQRFDQPSKPQTLCLPAGRGAAFRTAMAKLVEELRSAIPAAFETKEYQSEVEKLEEAFNRRETSRLETLGTEASQHGLVLLRTPSGFAFAPLKPGKDNEILSPEEFSTLPVTERERVENKINELSKRLEDVADEIHQWRKETREKIRALNREVTLYAVGHLIDELKKDYRDLADVLSYLDAVQQDVIDHIAEFRHKEHNHGAAELRFSPFSFFQRYQVNLLVDHSAATGAPVVYADHPTLENLVGRTEHISHMGSLVTDFTLLRAGALHQANGGYLLVEARKLLAQPYAWDALKRALRAQRIDIESLAQAVGLISAAGLEPQPIPLNIKIVLLGERFLFYLLYAYDADFPELFKVSVDFDEEMDGSHENEFLYARLIATIIKRESLRPFDRGAVARVIDQGRRLANHQRRLTAHFGAIADLLREADYWAGTQAHDVVTREDVQQAIDAQTRRVDRLQKKTYEEIRLGTLMIETTGSAIGQVNGLSVIDLGNHTYAHPARITAAVRLGEGEVVDIEREVELGGAIHSKGVLTLTSYLGARYARQLPLALSASLVFEQAYGPIEGDSASLAELCALLSALASTPLKQSLAVTGAVNQYGEVEPIGAVNEKIEGFYDACQVREHTLTHGVIIPRRNLPNLMLRNDVVDAVQNGTFRVYTVDNVDEAIELLSDMDAGHPNEEGLFPENSFNGRVALQLAVFTELRRSFSRPPPDEPAIITP